MAMHKKDKEVFSHTHTHICGPPTEGLAFNGFENIPLIVFFFETFQGNYSSFKFV